MKLKKIGNTLMIAPSNSLIPVSHNEAHKCLVCEVQWMDSAGLTVE